MQKILSGWGNSIKYNCNVYYLNKKSNISDIFENSKSLIARGAGRSYGDSSLAETVLILDKRKKIYNFNIDQGEIEISSDFTISELNDVTIPKGWIIPVTPGTSFATIGGCVASDVHGKNHHQDGCLSNHILSLEILTGDRKKILVSNKINCELFRATCGGMGLTGIITKVKIKLFKIKSNQIIQKNIITNSIFETAELLDEYDDYKYSVAWIDLSNAKNLGRGILNLGKFSTIKKFIKVRKKILSPPHRVIKLLLNNISIKLFNNFYFFYNKIGKKEVVVNYDSFFYPLDKIINWNKFYGNNGFIQYQLVIPKNTFNNFADEFLKFIKDKKLISYLTVLKLFGKKNKNYLTFPIEGYTLTMDIPYKKNIEYKLSELDNLVIKYKGKVYLTKDSLLSEKNFKKMYGKLDEFVNVRKKYKCYNLFKSYQSIRLNL